jgi:hypothetical protein
MMADHEAVVIEKSCVVPDWPASVVFAAPESVRDLTAALMRALERADDDAIEDASLEIVAEAGRKWRRTAPVRSLSGPRRAVTREELIGRVVRSLRSGMRACTARRGSMPFQISLSASFQGSVRANTQYARQVRLNRAREMANHGVPTEQGARLAGYSRTSSLKRAQVRSFR